MDRMRPKTGASQKKVAAAVIAVACALVGATVVLANIDFRTQRVDRTRLSIETVQQGTMEIKVGANGQLVSKRVEQLAAQVPGRVVKADIKPGALTEVGQVLVELANPQLVASAEEARSAWEGAVAELHAKQVQLQTDMMNEEVALTQVQFNLEKARMKAQSDEELANQGLIASIDMKRSQLDRDQLHRTYVIGTDRLKKLRENVGAELEVKKSRVAQLARALERARTEAADLKIIAGIRGIVQAISVDVGQQVQPGSPIGRIAHQDQLYAELKVPAREATHVQVGQKAVVDTRNGVANGTVTRVDPGVTDGTIVVDVDLQGPLPTGARPQLPVEGTIYVTQLPNTLYVGKPAYVQNDAEISVYRLDPGGRYATRTTIRAGKVSLNHIQVLQGLQAGDRIITSDIGEFKSQDRILLN